MNAIRNSVKAIIVRDKHLLVTKNCIIDQEWYLLPGGGQHHGESLSDALKRECMEEVGATITMGPLLYVRDYIGANHEFADADGHMHQVEFMFLCDIVGEYAPVSGTEPDQYQTGVYWLPLSELPRLPLYPLGLREQLVTCDKYLPSQGGAVYLGDMN